MFEKTLLPSFWLINSVPDPNGSISYSDTCLLWHHFSLSPVYSPGHDENNVALKHSLLKPQFTMTSDDLATGINTSKYTDTSLHTDTSKYTPIINNSMVTLFIFSSSAFMCDCILMNYDKVSRFHGINWCLNLASENHRL